MTASGNVKTLDRAKRAIMMADGTEVPIGDMRYIEGDFFRPFS